MAYLLAKPFGILGKNAREISGGRCPQIPVLLTCRPTSILAAVNLSIDLCGLSLFMCFDRSGSPFRILCFRKDHPLTLKSTKRKSMDCMGRAVRQTFLPPGKKQNTENILETSHSCFLRVIHNTTTKEKHVSHKSLQASNLLTELSLAWLRVKSTELNTAGVAGASTSRISARERPAPPPLYHPGAPFRQYPACLLRYPQPRVERPRHLPLTLRGR